MFCDVYCVSPVRESRFERAEAFCAICVSSSRSASVRLEPNDIYVAPAKFPFPVRLSISAISDAF